MSTPESCRDRGPCRDRLRKRSFQVSRRRKATLATKRLENQIASPALLRERRSNRIGRSRKAKPPLFVSRWTQVNTQGTNLTERVSRPKSWRTIQRTGTTLQRAGALSRSIPPIVSVSRVPALRGVKLQDASRR